MTATRISDVIRRQLERGELPERVRSVRPGRPAGEVLTWSEGMRCYVSDVTGECVWASFVLRGWGLDFCSARPAATQMEMVPA